MQEVVIDTLKITDFGPFYGNVEFDLRPVEDQRGILIGGKNGAGKTHLLRAIYLAVVGEKGMYDLKALEKEGSGATKFKFDQSLNRKAQSEGKNKAELEITLRKRDLYGESETWVIKRTIIYKDAGGSKWQSELTKPDATITKDDEDIQKIRDTLLPRHLARFFFFDAERSQDLHLSSEEIVTGVSRILGLWTYEKLSEDLRKLVRDTIPSQFNTRSLFDNEKKLSDLAADVTKTSGHLEAERQKQSALEDELKETEADIHQIEEDLRILGSIDPDEIEDMRLRRDEVKQMRDEYLQRLHSCWEKELPLALLGNLKIELRDHLAAEERLYEWQSSRDFVTPKIPQVKAEVFEDVPEQFVLAEDIQAFYLHRLDEALKGIFHPPPSGLPESIYVMDRPESSGQVRHVLGSRLSGFEALLVAVKEIERLESSLRELDSMLRRSQQDAETLVRCGELKTRHRNLITLTEELSRSLDECRSEQTRLESNLTELRRQEENQTRIVDKAKEGKSIIAVASKYREIAEEVQRKAAVALRSQISEEVGTLWTEIADRKHEFIGLEFDEHWNCNLLKHGGSKIQWDAANTSAGQQQVRMLAFYEALRRMASLVPPLVVDTPLGRLDIEVRTNVMERVYLSGHQAIILATNSEIDPNGDLFKRVKDSVGRMYTLEAAGEQDSSDYVVRVKDGYFGVQI